MAAGTFKSIDENRSWVERWAAGSLKPTAKLNLSHYIPGVADMEQCTLRFEINGRKIWIVFDGATHLGAECLSLVVRFVVDFVLQQRTVALKYYGGSFSGLSLVTAIDDVLHGDLKVEKDNVLGGTHDCCAVNPKCMRSLQQTAGYTNARCFPCLSHPNDTTGNKMVHIHWDTFWFLFNKLNGTSTAAKDMYRIVMAKAFLTWSDTRWGSDEESAIDMRQGRADSGVENDGFRATNCIMLTYCEKLVAAGIGDRLAPKMAQLLSSPGSAFYIEMQCAAKCIGGLPLVQCTYALEGDGGDLIFGAHQRLERVRVAMAPDRIFDNNAEIKEIAKRWVAWSTSAGAQVEIDNAARERAKCDQEYAAAEALAEAAAAAAIAEPDPQRPAQRQRRDAAVQSNIGQNRQAREAGGQAERASRLAKATALAIAQEEAERCCHQRRGRGCQQRTTANTGGLSRCC